MSGTALDPELRIDWIPAADLPDGLPGRLGLTFLPGKHGASLRYPGRVYRRDLARDVAALRAAGVECLVLLVTDAELARWGHPAIVRDARAGGLTVERWPIPDGAPPASLEELDAILASIRASRANGDVAVACMGGVGRTGTIAAAALVAAGWNVTDAVTEVRRVRHPEAVETGAQLTFLAEYASTIAARAG